MRNSELYTDDACSGNPGKGGWGAILVYKGNEKEISAYDSETTNNRMELTAVIEGLKALKEACHVSLTTDSKYVADALIQGWAKKWQSNNWKKPDKKPALNSDLWEELLALCDIHEVEITWVKGHAGHPYNERCDKLATGEIEKHNVQ